MDGQGGFKIIYKHEPNATLAVDFKPDLYARKAHPDISVESLVIARWERALEKNGKLFNASKFRFAGIEPLREKNNNVNGNTYVLKLGMTDYASFVGSHSGTNPLAEFGVSSLASPIGNAVIAITTDGYIPMLVRCAAVGEGSGYVVFPGGHPEPSDVVDIEQKNCIEGKVKREIWNAARRELIEELFVSCAQIPTIPDIADDGEFTGDSQFCCLGFVSRDHDGKVCQIFSSKLSVDKDTVMRQYTAGNQRKEESTHLLFVPVDNTQKVLEKKVVEGRKIMPDHLGALSLYNMHL